MCAKSKTTLATFTFVFAFTYAIVNVTLVLLDLFYYISKAFLKNSFVKSLILKAHLIISTMVELSTTER